LGKTKGTGSSDSCKEKRPAYTCRSKKALPVNEGSLGGTEKSNGQKSSSCQEKRRTYSCRTKEALRANESALGGKKEIWGEVALYYLTLSRL
jgi:hypothetical protein